jgi:hypothetical protein
MALLSALNMLLMSIDMLFEAVSRCQRAVHHVYLYRNRWLNHVVPGPDMPQSHGVLAFKRTALRKALRTAHSSLYRLLTFGNDVKTLRALLYP